MSIETIIFLGPSLPLSAAKKILPNACYHAPVRCGDIIKALRLHPKKLVIIDGYFEQTASVWHKEILLALSLGLEVYGASSMGALRAAELAPYGMVGHGQVFEWYRDNIIMDDDEVALVHTTDDKFESAITPMVNVRTTMVRAVKESIVTDVQADALLTEMKDQPYYQRSLFLTAKKLPVLSAWLKNNYVDQKRMDAESLLKQLNAPTLTLPRQKPREGNIPMTTSVFFNKIFRDMIVSPFEQPYEWLPADEKRYSELGQDPLFSTIQRIGKLLHVLHDLTGEASLIDWASQQPAQLPKERLLKHLHIYSDAYPTKTPHTEKTWELLLTLLNALMYVLKQRGAKLTVAKMLAFASDFRQKRQLSTTEQVMGWMQKNDLKDRLDFEYFVRDMSIVHYFVDHHQTGLLGVETDLTIVPWGIKAMALCQP
jgi:hypothetical protein